MLTSVLIGLLLGIPVGLALASAGHRRPRLSEDEDAPGALQSPQLLAWIDAATQGWLILAPDLSIAYINARSQSAPADGADG